MKYLVLFICSISWLDAKLIVSQEYWFKVFDENGQYWHVISGQENPIPPHQKSDYVHVSAGTEFQNHVSIEVLVPSYITRTFYFSSEKKVYKFSYNNEPIINAYEYVPPVEVTIPEQPIPEQDLTQFPWAYGNQEPLTHLKTVEQKNFNVDRYYLLEGKDSFDGVCNIILKIRWNFSLNTLPVNQINQTQFCSFNVSGLVTIHDSYIQNRPIEDGQYVHEFSHFNVDTTSISYANSEQIINGRFFYNFNQDIPVKAFYDSRSVVSGSSVTTSRDFVLNVPVYENFTFK